MLTIGTAVKPKPKAQELLVRVHTTTVNRTDCGILRGQPFPIRLFTGLLKPRSPVPGTDFAGVVEATGSQVTDFRVGDRVWGFNNEGLASQAEYLTIKQHKGVAKIPDGIAYEEVVACAEGAHNAYNFINKVTIKPPVRVLVNGATGAIGNVYLPLITKLTGGKRVMFPIPSDSQRTLNLMNELLTKGAFRPVIDRRYPMDAIKEAYYYVERGEKTGNVIVTYQQEKV